MTRRTSIADARLFVLGLIEMAHVASSALAGSPSIVAARISAALAACVRASTRRSPCTLVLALLMWFSFAPCVAQDNYRQQMKGLDEQVQEIKSDVLSIAQELNRLEEKLLYPSNTQIALFVALASGEALRLDAVQIQIDGQPVAHYIYSYKELEALQKGGMQRIYTGNVATGAHQLEVSIVGKLAGKDYSETGRFNISKGIEPKLVGITLAAPDAGRAPIEIGEW
jgi:hypothetical protein